MRVPTGLIGGQVTRTAFDYQVRLDFLEPRAELVIETPFLLRARGGAWHNLDPGTGQALAPVLDLFRRTVTAVEVTGRGTLHLTFDDEVRLCVDPHPHYESWHVSGTGLDPVTVGPGGEADWQLT